MELKMFNAKKIEKNKLQNALTGFCKNQDGAFLPMFGIAAFAIILSAGVAVDYSRMVNTRSRIFSAVDSAVLAAGNSMVKGVSSKAKVRDVFDSFIKSNLSASAGFDGSYKVDSFTVNINDGSVDAVISAEVPMYLTAIAGYESFPVSAHSKVVFSTSGIEVAMMLDVTGSMSGSKITAMKKAAKSAIDLLMPKNDKSGKVRIGLVPYSSAVNATSYYAKKVTNGASNKCVTERADNTDAVPNGSNVIENNSGYCPDSKIIPLTTKRRKLKNSVSKYKASGGTAGHIGIAWTYYMLSEKWQSVWKKDAKPSNYDSNVKKFAILMTDGEFNTYYLGGNQGQKSNDTAKSLCSNMKLPKKGANGIKVYSVAFQAPPSAKKTLQNCSSGADYYFDANSDAELVAAFKKIAENIQKLRLAQ